MVLSRLATENTVSATGCSFILLPRFGGDDVRSKPFSISAGGGSCFILLPPLRGNDVRVLSFCLLLLLSSFVERDLDNNSMRKDRLTRNVFVHSLNRFAIKMYPLTSDLSSSSSKSITGQLRLKIAIVARASRSSKRICDGASMRRHEVH